jgi:hypothetical protein
MKPKPTAPYRAKQTNHESALDQESGTRTKNYPHFRTAGQNLPRDTLIKFRRSRYASLGLETWGLHLVDRRLVSGQSQGGTDI